MLSIDKIDNKQTKTQKSIKIKEANSYEDANYDFITRIKVCYNT